MPPRFRLLYLVGLVPWTMVAAQGGPPERDERDCSRHVFRCVAMGTEFVLLIETPDRGRAERAAEAAWKRLDALDRVFSDYDPTSEARRLAASAPHERPTPVSRELWTVCRFARTLSEETNGAFDVTVGPLTRLWRRAFRQKRLPDPRQLAEARRAVGYRFLVIDPATPRIRLTRPGMRLDFGGIAKGYALDEILSAVRGQGIERALINGGGDLACLEAPQGTAGWPVRIATWKDAAPPPVRRLPPRHAVATSGDRWRFLEVGGKRYSHLIDPRTGRGVEGRRQVSVLARSGMEADALASALLILSPREAAALAARYPSIGAWITTEEPGEMGEFRIGARRDWFARLGANGDAAEQTSPNAP